MSYFKNVCLYYKGENHQDKALQFLSDNVSEDVLKEFKRLWHLKKPKKEMMRAEVITEIVTECEKFGLVLPEQQAYVLATVEWETNKTFKPVREAYWLSEAWRKENLRYYPFYGRGYVQITWESNYRKFTNILKDELDLDVDLVANPGEVMDHDIAKFILVYGFANGSFTGRNIKEFINENKADFNNARRCINGMDKHEEIAAIAQKWLKKLKPAQPKQYPSKVAKQIRLGEAYTGTFNLSTKTKYFSQRDNVKMPHRTCNSSTNAMYCDWVLRATGKKGLESDNAFLMQVLVRGDTIYHHVQTQVLKEVYGITSKWATDRDYDFVVQLIKAGFAVPVNILHRGSYQHPRGGHVILLIGFTDDTFIAHDPYGTLESNYSNHNGQFSKISTRQFIRRWQGGYRILS